MKLLTELVSIFPGCTLSFDSLYNHIIITFLTKILVDKYFVRTFAFISENIFIVPAAAEMEL